MARYHITKAGNPGVCKAKIKCPLGDLESDHYDSAEEARANFEKKNKDKTFASSIKNKKELNKGQVLAKEFFDLRVEQRELISKIDEVRDKDKEAYESLASQLREVNSKKIAIASSIRNLSWSDTTSPEYDSTEEIEVDYPIFTENVHILSANYVGYDEEDVDSEVQSTADNASKKWIDRLSTAEIKAVLIYTHDSQDYAIQSKLSPEEQSPEHREVEKHLKTALDKAPRLKRPLTIYSGISPERNVEYLEEINSRNKVTVDRVQSYSVNPGITPSFTFGEKGLVLETTVDKAAFTSYLSSNPEELEVLAPKGKYTVEEVKKDQKVFVSNFVATIPNVAIVSKEKSYSELSKELEEKYKARVELREDEKRNCIFVDAIVLDKEDRGKGLGSKIMREIIEKADKDSKRIALTPDTSFGASSVARLKKFYKQFGFVENKGRNKDFTIIESMFRPVGG